MIAQNYILNKRPSHNINSKKMMNSFNIYPNANNNMNQIQYMKRPSYNIKGNNINNNNYNPMSHIIVGKRPSYNSNFSVSNFLNNTEPNNNYKGFTKIKKLPNNNTNTHLSSTGKNMQIIPDNRDIKNKGLITGFEQDKFNQRLNNTYNNDNNNLMMNQYKMKYNINNKGNNFSNSSKIIGLPDKRIVNPLNVVNYPPNQNFGNNNNSNKIMIEKIPNYKNNYQNNVDKYPKNQFDNKMQYYGFNNY